MKTLFTAKPKSGPMMLCLETETEYVFNGGKSEHTLLKSVTSYERLSEHWRGYLANNGAPYNELSASSSISVNEIKANNQAANTAQRLTASELKYKVQATGSYFFDRSSMKFFGDTMNNYYVPVNPVDVITSTGEHHLCHELQRRKPVKHGLIASTYFDVITFDRILEANS